MENRESLRRRAERAKGVVLAAGITQGVLSAINLVVFAKAGNFVQFLLFGFGGLVLAVFFCVFKHPCWGIIYTVLYLDIRIKTVLLYAALYQATQISSVGLGIVIGLILAIGLLALFIYADYQAIVLYRIRKIKEN